MAKGAIMHVMPVTRAVRTSDFTEEMEDEGMVDFSFVMWKSPLNIECAGYKDEFYTHSGIWFWYTKYKAV